MAWTSKVGNFIKTKLATTVMNKVTSGLSNFADAQQTSKVAAKLLNKSPLEISDTAPQQHMQVNPYEYGSVYYPEETANLGEGHYIIFDIVSHNESKFKSQTFDNGRIVNNDQIVGEGSGISVDKIKNIKGKGINNSTRLRGVQSGLMSKIGGNHTYVSDSVILYTPGEAAKFSYTANYDATETGLAGDLGQAIGAVINSPGIMDKIKAGGEGLGGVGMEIGKTALFGAASIIPGFENAKAVYDKALGQAKNPNLETIFSGVPFREFSFPFVFAPKSEREKDAVHKIIQLFRFHMLPEHQNSFIGYFNTPSEFQITYMYRDRVNSYIPKISRCVLKGCSIDYAPDGKFHTYVPDEKGAPPVIIKMNLDFTETEIMTKETVAQGF